MEKNKRGRPVNTGKYQKTYGMGVYEYRKIYGKLSKSEKELYKLQHPEKFKIIKRVQIKKAVTQEDIDTISFVMNSKTETMSHLFWRLVIQEAERIKKQ